MVPTLEKCLNDAAPYVRKTAVLAAAKLHQIVPEFVTKRTCTLLNAYLFVIYLLWPFGQNRDW